MFSNLIQMDKEISSSVNAKLELQDGITYINNTFNSKSETLAEIINAIGTDLDGEKQRSQEKDMVLMNQVCLAHNCVNCMSCLPKGTQVSYQELFSMKYSNLGI